MLNLKHLRVLHELARQGTLAKTAQSLHFTPSAVSQQLSALQREAGVPLLEHVGRRVQLTPAAQQLVEHTQAVFDRLALAESELAAAQDRPRGKIRVASFHTVLLEIAPLALSKLARSAPELDVQLIHQEVEAGHSGLLAHDFDLVLGEEYPGLPVPAQPGVHREDFYTDPLRLVVPARGIPGPAPADEAGQDLGGGEDAVPDAPRTLADLAQAAWAFEPPGTRIYEWAATQCRTAGFHPRVLFETPDPLLHLQLVRRGHAVAFVPALLGDVHLAGVVPLDLPGHPARTLFTEVRAGRQSHPALLAVRQAFQQAAEALTRSPASRTLEA